MCGKMKSRRDFYAGNRKKAYRRSDCVFGFRSFVGVFGAVTLATGLGTMSDLAKKIVGALFVVSGGVLTIVMLARLLGRPVEILLCDEFMLAVNKKSKFTLSAKPAAADDKYLYFRKSDVDSVFYCKAQRFGKDKDYFKYLWLCVLLGFLGFFIVCLIILIDNRGQYYPAKIILKFSDKQMLALYNVRKPEEVSRLLKGFVKDKEPVPVFGLSEDGEAQSRDNAADVQTKD